MTENDQASLTPKQKAQAALEAASAVRPIDEIAQDYGVAPAQVRQWKQVLIDHAASLFREGSASPAPDAGLDASLPGAPNRRATSMPELGAAQMEINEALVFKIFELQRAEDALQQSTSSLHQLLGHQEQIKEEERKRIAREIHDDLGQNLMALRIDISMLHARTTRSHRRLHGWTGMVLSNVDATIKSVRSIMNDLRPFELELGLLAAVEWQVKRFERSGIACRLNIAETPFGYALGDERTLAIFRILQESLSNIARHSAATEAEVTLGRDEQTFSMMVRDNGVGMCPNERSKMSSFGIVGIKERLSSFGGELIIDHGKGEGLALLISMPVGAGDEKPDRVD